MMMGSEIYRILVYPNKILMQKAAEVKELTEVISRKIAKMKRTLAVSNCGIGLAAPQVGIPLRILIIDIPETENDKVAETSKISQKFVMINPKIKIASKEKVVNEEGCLSLPEISVEVERFSNLDVEFFDENWIFQSVHAEGLLAICIQHEIDHLDGVLIVDRVPSSEREQKIAELMSYKNQ